MQQEERERRMLVAQQIAAELRLKAEAREREQRKQRKQEERAAATAAAAAAAAGAGAGAGERSGGPPPSSSAAAAAPAVAARSFFNPRDRPTARQQAEMEREEEEARVRRRARASAAAAAAAEREAAEAAAAAAAAAAKKNKGKKRVLEDEDGDGERRANSPPLALRPLPPKRTAVAISPRLTTARPRQQQQQQWQQQRQQQQPFSSSPSLVRPPAVAVAFPAPPAAAPATRRTEMNLVQLLQQRRQQQQQRATAAGGNGRKRPAAAAARGGAPPLVSSSSRATAAAAAAASSFRGVPASADQEAHLAAANDLLAAEAMDGRLWFAACADGDEEGGTGGGAAAAGAAPPSPSSLPPVPASFPSARAYVGSFLPLVLEEARQEVRSSWAEAVAAGNKSWPVSVERVDGLGGGGEGGGAAAAAAAAGAAEAEAKAKAAPESPFCGPPLSSRTAAAAAMPPGAAPPLSASSPPSPPAPAVEARLRFPGARPPPGALRDGDVVVVTRGLPPGGRGGAGKGEGPEEPPLDWAAGGRARAAAEGVELEEGELALDAAAAAAARAATASGQQQQPLRPPPPATGRDRGGACPVAGVIRFSGNAVTLTTRCRCPRHHRGGGGAGAGKGGGEEEDPPCVAALRSLAAAASSPSSSSATRQEDGGRRWHLTVVGNLVTHAREVAALFAMPAMPLARALLSPGAAAAAAGAAAARWPSEASSRAFIGKLQETYDHAQLRAIEVAAGHLSAGGGGGGGGGSCDRRDGGGGSSAPPRPPLFTLVQGPPGTGKTHTVTGILNVWHLVAYQRHHAATIAALTRGGGGGGSGSGGGAFPPGLLADFAPTLPFATNSSNSNSKPRLLVCAPSNAAADELLARVMDRGFFDGHGRTYRPDVVRVGADSSPMTERAREVWVEGNALALLEAPPAQRSAELQQARWDSARARRQVEALRLSFPPAPSASASAAASAAAAAGAAAREAAAGDLAAAADALDKVEALVERLEIADRAAQGGGGNGGGGGGGADRRQARERLEALLVSRAEVVFTTLSSTGRRVFRRLAAVFDTVLVDEAAQATEPALLQALRFGARSVALVGDPRQLPATVRSGGAARAGLARSLFERLAGGEGGGGGGGARGARGAVGRGPRLAVGSSPAPSRPAPPAAAAGVPVELLRVQYRMHPEIRSFPSRAFYAGALEDSAAVRSRPAEPWQRREGGGGGLLLGPYLFFDVARGREARGAGRGGAAPFFASGSLSSTPSFSSSASASSSSPSLRNDEEAALAAALVAELRRECSRLGAPFPSVGVITPYRAQAAALRQELERAGGGRGGRGWCTAVETVDGFQGKEVDVAIVSCVRSRGGGGRDYRHDGGGDGDGSDAAVAAVASLSVSLSSSTLGFVDDLRRLNVAVTRARRALWVLGSGEALRRGSGAWAALLADASRRGLVVRGEDAWGRIRHRAQGQQEGRGGAGGEGGGTSL